MIFPAIVTVKFLIMNYYNEANFRFTCNRNFFLDGSTTSTCRDDNDNDVEGVWDNPAPTCVQITCAPPHIDPMNGVVGCTDTNNLGSECT